MVPTAPRALQITVSEGCAARAVGVAWETDLRDALAQLGRAPPATGSTLRLAGVEVEELAALPDVASATDTAAREADSTRFLPALESVCGDEGTSLVRLADVITKQRHSPTVVVNGGDLTRRDLGR